MKCLTKTTPIFIINSIELIYIKIEKLMNIHLNLLEVIIIANIKKITLQNKYFNINITMHKTILETKLSRLITYLQS
jgi:hypothetical protein